LGVAFSLRFNKFDLSAAASRAFRASAFALLTGFGFFGSFISRRSYGINLSGVLTLERPWRRASHGASPCTGVGAMAGSRAKGRGREILPEPAAILVRPWSPDQSRHSSVVEHVIGNDGVDCSIQSGGTIPQRVMGLNNF
jgi:hypothetical protein